MMLDRRMTGVLMPMLLMYALAEPASAQNGNGGGEEPGEGGKCMNCAQGTYYGQTAHWWVGTDGCEPIHCLVCVSEHCDDPTVPHYGPCSGACCLPDGGDSPQLARAFEQMDPSNDLRTLAETMAETQPQRFVMLRGGNMVAVLDSGGWVTALYQIAASRPNFSPSVKG
jgi:hypothetical protein